MGTQLREREACTTYVADGWADADLRRRVRAEFREMPGMHLSGDQAARLWSLDHQKCGAILSGLVASGFLRRDQFDRYVLAHNGQ